MLDIIKKNENEYVCVIDDNGLYQMIGKHKDEIVANLNIVTTVVSEAMKMLVNKFGIDEEQYNINVQLYTTENFVIVVNMYPLNETEDQDDDEDEDDEVASTSQNSGQRHQWDTLPTVNNVMFVTNNIENIIAAQKNYRVFELFDHTLFHMDKKYIICLRNLDDLNEHVEQDIRSMLTEYTQTIHNFTYDYLCDYAKLITTDIPAMVDVLAG